MQKYPTLTKEFYKGCDRGPTNSMWGDVATELNISGPPLKNVRKKKIYSYLVFGQSKITQFFTVLASRCQEKLAHNKNQSCITGGGQYDKYVLMVNEGSIAVITSMT